MAVSMRNDRATRNRNQPRLMSEINVTPFVDVMLVLLVIFMITSPMLVTGIKVDLPETSSTLLSKQKEPLSISITHKGKIYLQDKKVKMRQLGRKLQSILGENKDAQIIIQGSKRIDYGKVVQVLNIVNEAGFSKVALRTHARDS